MSNTSIHPSQTPHHHVEADLYHGPLHLSAAFNLTAPWTVLFGPSGSGKSTILRAICGVFPKSAIDFASAGPDSKDALQQKHHSTPPHRRNLAYAPQSAILFPHLSVRENIAFATEARHQTNPQLIDTAINLFDLAQLTNRRPRDLSGGERQRVNLARAFAVPSPHLLLLDEPFTGVDRALRDTLLLRMQQHATQHGIPVLSVTHDVEEALLLNAEVIRLTNGRITAQGPAAEVLAPERTQMLATLQP
jgi:molybdate transport system ATP-binding protein